MKKILTFLLVLILLIVMPFSIACNETPDNNGDPPSTEEGNPGNEDGGDGGSETPGGDNGGETPGGDNNEGENSGGGNTGGDNTEGENPGDNSGSTDPKPPMTGEGEIPDDDRGTIIK